MLTFRLLVRTKHYKVTDYGRNEEMDTGSLTDCYRI